jgi:hypothetical protein
VLRLRKQLTDAGWTPARTPSAGNVSATTRSTRPAASPCASTGRLHHIGVGRTHTGTDVMLLVHDLHIRVIHAATGELLRDLVLDPRKDYQPTGRPLGPARK